MIIIPIKWLFHWEYTLFSDKPNWIGVTIPQGILSSGEIVGFTAINHPQITMFIGDISDMFPNGTVVVQMALGESHIKLCND